MVLRPGKLPCVKVALLMIPFSAIASASINEGTNTLSAANDKLELAVLKDGRAPIQYHLHRDSTAIESVPLTASSATAMGSVWKLFVYFYLSENKMQPSRYVCKGEDREELFCCKPNGDIGLDEALSKSCGSYFAPARLNITDSSWRSFWVGKIGLHFDWLISLAKLRPGVDVPVVELLQALEKFTRYPESFGKINAVLAQVVIDGTARGAVKRLGSSLRVKTFTWDDPSREGKFLGGFAGWLTDGSPVWGRAQGSSAQVLSIWSKRIAEFAETRTPIDSNECVRVAFFERYPIKEILELPSRRVVSGGPLNGKFRVSFSNGNHLDFTSNGELRSEISRGGAKEVTGRFSVNNYIARVIDREIDRSPLEAARAFGILIRTYLYQNAKKHDGCYAIADSTRMQRVSANPPSAVALKIANWSDRMVIKGVSGVRYHQAIGGPNVLSWARAKDMASRGSFFDEILRASYPSMQLGFAEARSHAVCQRLPDAEKWIQRQNRAWLSRLSSISGFQPPERIKVCRSTSAQPYSDSDNNVIYMKYSGDLEDQITAAHEYLHLAFKYHPNGLNEAFIEARAKDLVVNQGQVGGYEIR
ncbi:MAG: DUF2300 domain-containing protein [Oligoflexia bacterium]|nr:DUF2300 domain-containing protein [Oligoflexia bacterium]